MDAREFEKQFNDRTVSMEISPTGLSCKRCWDSGFVWLSVDISEGKFHACWAYCRCHNGKLKHKCDQFRLPLYDYEMERLFQCKDFPVKAFIPSSFKSFDNGLESKVRDFKRSLRESEKFWSEQK